MCVAGYTAYIQRQQVRAAVWPILEFDSSNAPDIHFMLANKGVGPALIRHVVVRVDDQPGKNWREAMEKLLGPGEHLGAESDMSGRAFAGDEIDRRLHSAPCGKYPAQLRQIESALDEDE